MFALVIWDVVLMFLCLCDVLFGVWTIVWPALRDVDAGNCVGPISMILTSCVGW